MSQVIIVGLLAATNKQTKTKRKNTSTVSETRHQDLAIILEYLFLPVQSKTSWYMHDGSRCVHTCFISSVLQILLNLNVELVEHVLSCGSYSRVEILFVMVSLRPWGCFQFWRQNRIGRWFTPWCHMAISRYITWEICHSKCDTWAVPCDKARNDDYTQIRQK